MSWAITRLPPEQRDTEMGDDRLPDLHPLREDRNVDDAEAEDGEIHESSFGSKRKAASHEDENPEAKRVRSSGQSPGMPSFLFDKIRNPKRPIHCAVQVNNENHVGSIWEVLKDVAVQVFLNGRLRETPTVGLIFKHPGIDGKQLARFTWHVDTRCKKRWALEKMTHGYVLSLPPNESKRGAHAGVLETCQQELQGHLAFIILSISPSLGDFINRESVNRLSDVPRTCITTIFSTAKACKVRIWFLAYGSNGEAGMECLDAIRSFLAKRTNWLDDVQDDVGKRYSDWQLSKQSGKPAKLKRMKQDPPSQDYDASIAVPAFGSIIAKTHEKRVQPEITVPEVDIESQLSMLDPSPEERTSEAGETSNPKADTFPLSDQATSEKSEP